MSKSLVSEDTAHLGPAMKALNRHQRLFVSALFTSKPGHGQLALCAKEAGYGTATSSPASFASIANRLVNNDRVIEAIKEQTKKLLRSAAPKALSVVHEILNDITHKDRLKAANAILERVDPVETKHSVEVTHKINHTKNALDHLAYLKSLGVSHDKLVEEFGEIGLAHYTELLEAIEKAQPIDVEYKELPAPEGLDDQIAKEVSEL